MCASSDLAIVSCIAVENKKKKYSKEKKRKIETGVDKNKLSRLREVIERLMVDMVRRICGKDRF